MAKEKQNVSQLIRDCLTESPQAMPVDIVAMLAEKGVKTTTNYVSTIKCNYLGSNGTKTKAAVSVKSDTLDGLRAAVAFASTVGGVRAAKELFDVLAEAVQA